MRSERSGQLGANNPGTHSMKMDVPFKPAANNGWLHGRAAAAATPLECNVLQPQSFKRDKHDSLIIQKTLRPARYNLLFQGHDTKTSRNIYMKQNL